MLNTERFKELKSQIEAARQTAQELTEQLRQEMLAACPFKVGDKVVVDARWDTSGAPKLVTCYINHISVLRAGTLNNKYEYGFVKVKKDGTMSQQSASIYSYQSITKAE